MRVVIAAIGRLKQGPERELAARYLDRAVKSGRALGLRGIEIAESEESQAREATERIKAEGGKLLAQVADGAALVVLDGKGDACSSEALARRIAGWRDEGRPALVFAIGGPDGLAEAVRRRADLVLAFGQATFPHQLVRVLLLEQLYRATTILAGHPYHRA